MAESKTSSAKRVIAQSVVVLLSGGFTLLFVEFLPIKGPLIALGAFYAFLASAVVVHEFGHFCAALLWDFRILAVSLGPLRIASENGKLRFRRNRDIPLGGMVAVAPKSAHSLRRRMLFMVLAGPLSSFATGSAAIILGVLAGGAGAWALSWGMSSVFIGAINSIPAQKFFVSDGARVLMLLRATPQADRCCAQLLIAGAVMSGVRPRDWDRDLLSIMLAVRDSSGDTIVASIMAYEAAMDRRDFAGAEQHLSAALAGRATCPPVLRAGLALNAAFYESVVRSDALASRKWFQECTPKLIVDRYFLLLVEAAVLLAEQHPAEAREKANQCLRALPQARFPGFAKASLDWARLLLTRAQAQMTATTSE